MSRGWVMGGGQATLLAGYVRMYSKKGRRVLISET